MNVANVYSEFQEIFNTSTTTHDEEYKCLLKLENIFYDIDKYLTYLHAVAEDNNLSEIEEVLAEYVKTWHTSAPAIRSGKHLM